MEIYKILNPSEPEEKLPANRMRLRTGNESKKVIDLK